MEQIQQRSAGRDSGATEQLLLSTLTQLAREMSQSPLPDAGFTLDSSLSRDLGFDSLARVEMTMRIEDAFSVRLPTGTLSSAESPGDLLREILRVQRSGQGTGDVTPGSIEPTAAASRSPDQVRTLQELLAWHVDAHPNREHIYLLGEHGQVETILTYRQLFQGASRVAEGLLARGLESGQTVAIMLPTSLEYFHTFFGILLARGIPVPLYPPARLSQLEDHLSRHATILDNAGAVLLVTFPEALALSHLLKPMVPSVRQVVTVSDLLGSGNVIAVGRASGGDLAFLQYTSGSTGNPKGVMLTHANVLANLRAMGKAIGVSRDDRFVSWLPLYHDMGLIGAWLGSLYYSLPLISIPPQLFLARPLLWLQAISHYRATISASPNFGYELCLRLRDKDLETLDLSSWRLAFNGAEPVSASTVRRFTARFAACGFPANALQPVYGLAESSVGVAFPPLGRAACIDRIHRQDLAIQGVARKAEADAEDAMEIVSAGQPMPGHEVRIVDAQGHELPEREEGRLQFRGPSTSAGYYRDPEKSRAMFDGEWANSGDLAYIADGDIFITGRSKDLIIRAGRNIYPQELESAVSGIPGIRSGCVVVFGVSSRADAIEKLVIVAETRESDATVLENIRREIRHVALDILGAHADDIQLVPPRTIPKTSSGKLRRSASAELYRRGLLRHGRRAVWWQVARLGLAGLEPRLHKMLLKGRDLAYAGWCWMCLAIMAPVIWAVVVCLPGVSRRRRFVQAGARLLLWLTGTRLQVYGREHVPENGCILVANHASYLDGLVVLAVLSGDFHFVAKEELRHNVFSRLFLERLDCRFVERFDTEKSVADSRRLYEEARAGRTLFFFPEGTFRRMPGIAPFHLGAFMCAVEAGSPVLPVTLCGTRSKLREDSWYPRRGNVSIHFGEALHPTQGGWPGAIALRDAARGRILHQSGEPDLGSESLHG